MSKQQLTTGVAVAVALAVVSYFFFTNPFETPQPAGTDETQLPADQVVIQDVVAGTGAEAVPGAKLKVNYIGKLQSGETFDQTTAESGPREFVYGVDRMIAGWEQGIQGMKAGGTRIIIVPPSLGYGNQQMGPIPPNSTLIFQVQLVDVTAPSGAPETN